MYDDWRPVGATRVILINLRRIYYQHLLYSLLDDSCKLWKNKMYLPSSWGTCEKPANPDPLTLMIRYGTHPFNGYCGGRPFHVICSRASHSERQGTPGHRCAAIYVIPIHFSHSRWDTNASVAIKDISKSRRRTYILPTHILGQRQL